MTTLITDGLIHRWDAKTHAGGNTVRAEEVIWLYQQGERNFRGQKLVGQSFAGQDLSGADFSKADIRGANFASTCLRGCLFVNAQAGLSKFWASFIFLTAIVACAMLGVALSFVNTLASLRIEEVEEYGFEAAIMRWVVIAVLTAFLLIARYWDMEAGFSMFTLAFVSAIAVTGLNSGAKPISGTVAIAIMIAYLTVILAGLAGIVVAIAAYTIVEAAVVVIIGVFAFSALLVNPSPNVDLLMMTLAISIALLTAYACWRALRHGQNNTVVSNIVGTAVTFVAARVGTSFRGADLTYADFSGAKLNGADFSQAITGNAQSSMLLT